MSEPTLQDFIAQAKTSLAGNAVPDDHLASVQVNSDGLVFSSSDTNLSDTGRKLVRLLPSPDEGVESLQDNKGFFDNLQFMNLLLTNACNLSCSYCYEQHGQDFGRYSNDTILNAWNWLKNINNLPGKTMQFFGGEPLIHKKLILDFLRENREEVESQKGWMNISITTNGLLLTDEFIDEYFSYPNTKMMISIDTLDAEKDHREIGQDKIDFILGMVEKITAKLDNITRFSIRSTISKDNAGSVRQLWEALHERGVRQMVFHPLILSYSDGYIGWTEDEWSSFEGDIKGIIDDYPDDARFVQIVEGVGFRGKTNCLTGSNTIAVDPAGDFSGCYFFTNRKGSNTGDLLIGNIFADEFFKERYLGFSTQYDALFEDNEQCRKCDMKGICYQCPAGNISTGNKLFRPDGMCQKLVQLHLDIKQNILMHSFKRKLISISEAFQTDGDVIYKRSLLNLIIKYLRGYYTDPQEIEDALDDDLPVSQYAGFFAQVVKQHHPNSLDHGAERVVHGATKADLHTTMRDLYYSILEARGIGHTLNPDVFTGVMDEDVVFCTLIHFVVGNDTPFGQGG